MNKIIQELNSERAQRKFPDFNPGDTVVVQVKVVEGDRERFGLVWRILEGLRRVLHLILLLIIFGFVLAALHTSIPSVPRSAALVVAPEGELVEQLATDPVRRALGQASGGPAPETLLKDVIDAIQMAKGDSRIK